MVEIFRMSFKADDVKHMPCQPHDLSFPSRSFRKTTQTSKYLGSFVFLRSIMISIKMLLTVLSAVKEGKVRLTGISESSFLVK